MTTLESQLKDLKNKIEANKVEKMLEVEYTVGVFKGKRDLLRASKAGKLVAAKKAILVKPEKKEDI